LAQCPPEEEEDSATREIQSFLPPEHGTDSGSAPEDAPSVALNPP
jgi:hypothetical protein